MYLTYPDQFFLIEGKSHSNEIIKSIITASNSDKIFFQLVAVGQRPLKRLNSHSWKPFTY